MNWKALFYSILGLFIGAMIGISFATAETWPPAYTIQNGDTLSSIAEKYGTTWEKIYELNPYIKDPNLIYPGQVISLDPTMKITRMQKAPKSEPEWVTPEVFKERLTQLMFKEIGIAPLTQVRWENFLIDDLDWTINRLKRQEYYLVRKNTDNMKLIMLGLETHELARVLTDIYREDPEQGCLMTALAWVETGFHNRRGHAGEVGYYQILPSTLKDIYGKDKYQDIMLHMEANTKFATDFAIWYLGSLKKECGSLNRALYRYNGHPSYPALVQYRLSRVRKLCLL